MEIILCRLLLDVGTSCYSYYKDVNNVFHDFIQYFMEQRSDELLVHHFLPRFGNRGFEYLPKIPSADRPLIFPF
jgi:hypothetical protein